MVMHKLWWLWLPAFIFVVQIILEVSLPAQVLAILHSESGPHEFLQFFIIFIALLVSIATLLRYHKVMHLWLIAWVGIAALSCLYVAGEELSWGQHFLIWSTPEYWLALNDQGETNFHNTSSWLDQKPRLILEIGVILGGILMPLLMKFKSDFLPVRFAIIYPSSVLAVVAGIFLALKIIDKLDVFGVFIFERGSEVQELYMFYFILLYLLMLRQRIAKHTE